MNTEVETTWLVENMGMTPRGYLTHGGSWGPLHKARKFDDKSHAIAAMATKRCAHARPREFALDPAGHPTESNG